MKDKLYFCKKCNKKAVEVIITEGYLYPCSYNYGRFKCDYMKGIKNFTVDIEEITETCNLQKRIEDFEILQEDACEYFLENIIESKNRE